MDKVKHNTQVFKLLSKYNYEKDKTEDTVDVVCADVYKINIDGHFRLICAYRYKRRWTAMDVLSGIALQGGFTTKTAALQAIEEYFVDFLNPKYPHIRINHIENLERYGKVLFKLLDEDQKICYNNLVDLCVN